MGGMNRYLVTVVVLAIGVGCVTSPSRPCTEAGEPARDKPFAQVLDRRCEQRKGPEGRFVNVGRYQEWYPGGQVALEGDYKEGKKSGKWIEWSADGKKVGERWFENGVETQTREQKVPTSAPPVLPPATQPEKTKSR
jgi:hypothetical protein